MDELTRKRIEKTEDNTQARVVEVLEVALDDIKSGRTPANKMLLLLAESVPGETFDIDEYRAGVTRIEEAGMLAIFQHRHMKHWLG